MRSERCFFKTKITVTVLSEDVPIEFDGLEELGHAMDSGDAVGSYVVNETKALDSRGCVRWLKRLGSEPAFFCLNDKGEDDEG